MDNKVKIAAIVPYPIYPAKMGGQKGIALFYQYLSERCKVCLVTTGNQQPQNFTGTHYPVLGNGIRRYADVTLYRKLLKIFRQEQITHIILEHPYYGWLAWLLKKKLNIPLIVHSHNIEALRFKSTGRWWWKLLSAYEGSIHKQTDVNFFITEEDKRYAIDHYDLDPSKCHVVTYGTESSSVPTAAARSDAKEHIRTLHSVKEDERILFFNGTLTYKPNMDAVDVIVKHIVPYLQKKNFKYKIIICGKGLPASYAKESNASDNIIFAGFVDDVTPYFIATDIFINPVIEGGGIKTKIVEALGYNLCVVSTKSGAIGIPADVAGSKLAVAADNDWEVFTGCIMNADLTSSIPQAFYDHFYWGNIAERARNIITGSL